jgi:hypothetical protein
VLANPCVCAAATAGPLTAAILSRLLVRSAIPLEQARGAGLDRERLQAQLGRLGGTGWQLTGLDVQIEGATFLPLAELNRLRRQLVDQLQQALEASSGPVEPSSAEAASPPPHLPALIRELAPVARPQAQAAAWAGGARARSGAAAGPARDAVHSVVADFDQPRELREAVAIGRGCWPGGVWLAGPRVTRPDEAWSLEPLLRSRTGRLPGAQCRPTGAAHRSRALRGGFQPQCGQPPLPGLVPGSLGPRAGLRQLRPQSAPAAAAAAGRPAGAGGGDGASAHAPLSHGALSVLCLSLQRPRPHRLWSPL